MSEFSNDRQNQFRIMSEEQVDFAVRLSDQVLQDSPDRVFVWPTSVNEQNAIVRREPEIGGETILASKIILENDRGQVEVTRYLLELHTGAFLIIPGLYDNIEEIGTDDDTTTNYDVVAMMQELGHRLPTDEDWDDFLRLMEDGNYFLETLRSIEEKVGKKAAEITDEEWNYLLKR